MARPLDGVRVLDLSRVLAGPYCTQLLADLGAEVWKVERPGTGDDTRAWGPPFSAGESAYFLSVNRGKQSVAIDLSTAAGADLSRALAARADVLVENFRPGAAARLGLDPAALATEHPRLVVASLSGFGAEGPDSDRTGYDALVQAMGGLMSINGEEGAAPLKVGVALADVIAGQLCASGILAALLERERTGRGRRVEVALQDALVAALVNQAQAALVSGQAPRRMGSLHPHIVPYQPFETADGWLVLACGNDAQFEAACAVLGLGELAQDPRFATNGDRVRHRDQLVPALARVLLGDTTASWTARLTEARVPAGPIRDLTEVLGDPQLTTRGMVREVQHPTIGALELVGNPVRIDGESEIAPGPPPLLGEHTDRVLAVVLGLDERELARLREAGAIGG